MNRLTAKWGLFVALSMGVGVLLEQGCTAKQAKTVEANGAYGAQVGDCVRMATSKAAGLACMDAVDRAWGLDGGAQ